MFLMILFYLSLFSYNKNNYKVLIYLMRKILKPAWIEKYTEIYRHSGWKGIVKEGGIKLIVIFFIYYLIRDSILYLLPIYLGLHTFQSCGH